MVVKVYDVYICSTRNWYPQFVYPERSIRSRASIFTHVRDEWLRERADPLTSLGKIPSFSRPFSRSPHSRGRFSWGRGKDSSNERDLSLARYVTTIFVDFDSHRPFSDFEKRSNALPCQDTGLRDACWEKRTILFTSCCSFANERNSYIVQLDTYYCDKYFIFNRFLNDNIFVDLLRGE